VTEAKLISTNSRPPTLGDKPLPRRDGPKGLLPSTWLERPVRLSYVDARGAGCDTKGLLLDTFPAGAVFALSGAKVLVSWDAIRLIELVEN
jgi:hypothetical protein